MKKTCLQFDCWKWDSAYHLLQISHSAIGSTDVGREVVGALIEVVIGIVAGLFLGFFISYIPPSKMQFKVRKFDPVMLCFRCSQPRVIYCSFQICSKVDQLETLYGQLFYYFVFRYGYNDPRTFKYFQIHFLVQPHSFNSCSNIKIWSLDHKKGKEWIKICFELCIKLDSEHQRCCWWKIRRQLRPQKFCAYDHSL